MSWANTIEGTWVEGADIDDALFGSLKTEIKNTYVKRAITDRWYQRQVEMKRVTEEIPDLNIATR